MNKKKGDGLQTPQTIHGGIQFPNSTVQESAPTTKLNNDDGNLSERLQYNRDPLSYNRNRISIDDDGNINLGTSPSPSPIRPRSKDVYEDPIAEEAKTFHSQHLLFSHLMSFDTKRHTLSKLNNASQATLFSKGVKNRTRDS